MPTPMPHQDTATPPAAPAPSHISRGRSLHHILTPSLLHESLQVRRPASLRNAWAAGVQVALASVIVAALLHISPWAHLAGFASLGALSALFGRFAASAHRRAIVALAGTLLVVPVALLSLLALTGAPMVWLLVALALVAGVLASVAHRLQLGAPGAVIFVFAASAALSPLESGAMVAERTAATALGALVAWLVCWSTDALRDRNASPGATPAPASPASTASSTAIHSAALGPGYAPRQALRVALCAGIASLLAHAAGLEHAAWAGIGAIAVMQGVHLPNTMHRAWQRTLGTCIGAGIAWAILSTSPSFWQILLAVAVFQVVTELVIGLNYALGQMTITPMALLMTALSVHTEATAMAVSRIADTALGAVVGIALAVLLSTLDERLYLARHRDQLHLSKA